MPETAASIRIRPVSELDLDSIVRIDERITGAYRPEDWERRMLYYLRRDPEGSQVAELDGKLAELGERSLDGGSSMSWEYLLVTARKR